MKAIDRKLKVLTSIMLRISVVLLFLFVAIYLYREVNDGSYHIQEFQVPRQISEMGYSGDVVARKIQNRVVEFVGIANRTWSQKELEEYSQSADRTQLQVEVAGIGFSPQVLVRSLKGTFGIPSKEISGEVTYAGKRLRLTLRVTGQKNAFVLDEEMVDQSEGDAMESLIVKSAQKVLEINNPLLLGILFTGDITTSEIKHNDSLGIKMFRLAIATKPEQAAHAYVWWARSIFDISGDSILASRKLAKALSIDPETALAYHYLAQMKFHNGDFVEGERLMKKALELDPTSHWSWRALGWRYKRGNGERDNEAIQCYRKAIELGLNNPNDEMDLAFLYYYNNKYDEALDLIESKENLGIRYDLPLKYLVLKNLNDSLQADIELDRLRVDSKDSRRLSDRFNRLAYELEERKNKWPDAFELANLAIQLDSTNAYPFTTKAELSGLAGDEQGFYNNLELAIRKGFDLSEIDEHDEPYHKYSGDQRYQLLREKHKIRQ
jgi:tetratricopeptide (TPR) repeat protein